MNMSKKEVWQAIIGIIATVVWLFGNKAGVPAEAVTYAQATVGVVIGHVLGSLNSEPAVTIEATAAQDSINQQGESK